MPCFVFHISRTIFLRPPSRKYPAGFERPNFGFVRAALLSTAAILTFRTDVASAIDPEACKPTDSFLEAVAMMASQFQPCVIADSARFQSRRLSVRCSLSAVCSNLVQTIARHSPFLPIASCCVLFAWRKTTELTDRRHLSAILGLS